MLKLLFGLVLLRVLWRLVNKFIFPGWTAADMKDQSGKAVLVTGVSVGGLGYQTALEFARKGATVILAVRNMKKGQTSLENIKKEVPKADVHLFGAPLDLADLSSVRAFTDKFLEDYPSLDLLINNAGIMAIPERKETKDGFEMQWGTNYLGPWLLTKGLLPALEKAGTPERPSRIMCVSSSVTYPSTYGNFDIDDLQYKKRPYAQKGLWKNNTMLPYGQSKLCNIFMARHLNRIFKEQKSNIVATVAHPGYTSTNLQKHIPAQAVGNFFLGQDIPNGVLPSLYAATEAPPDTFTGPRYIGWGPPRVEGWSKNARNPEQWEALWKKTEELVGS